jgi:hypothetical protein
MSHSNLRLVRIEVARRLYFFASDRYGEFGLHRGRWHPILALRRVTNFFDRKKQFLSLRGKILNEMVSVCDDQAFILGAKVEKLEQAIRALCGEGPAVRVSSGTDAELLIWDRTWRRDCHEVPLHFSLRQVVYSATRSKTSVSGINRQRD